MPASTATVLVVAAIGGAGTMVVELAAVRLLAPWFGSSLIVWTNVIAVVLLALALGYLVGGRLSAGGDPRRRLGTTLLCAASWTALLPALSGAVARGFVPADLALSDAAEVVLWGSLAASLVLFLPPALLLGAVAPLAVEAVQRGGGGGGHAGRSGGLVLAASTLGSLCGVFGTSHFLLPSIGIAQSFAAAAGALGAAGLLGLATAPRRAAAGAVALVLALLAGLGLGRARPSLPDGVRQLGARESRYQSVRVVEDTRGGAPLRYLQVNEGFDSYQSVWQPEPGLLPEGFYYNDFALPLAWSPRAGPFRVLVLGLGAGTAFRVLAGAAPPETRLELVGVELDPAVVELARAFMDLGESRDDRRVLAGLDARVALGAFAPESFDEIVLDCYANQVEIPAHLCTLELFREVRERLAPEGWLVANLGGFGFDDPVVSAVAETCAAAFESAVLLVRVPRSRNFTLFARRDAPLPLDGEGRLLQPETAPWKERLAPRLLPGATLRVEPPVDTDELLRDDRSPVERLQLRSIEHARELLGGEA